MHKPRLKQRISILILSAMLLGACFLMGFSGVSNAQSTPGNFSTIETSTPLSSPYYCGQKGSGGIQTSIDIGCSGKGEPIPDLIFALIRLLSDGVGIVVIASIIVAGIQFTTSRGDPQASAKAIGRVRSSVIALAIYIFAYAILNYVIPAGFFNR